MSSNRDNLVKLLLNAYYEVLYDRLLAGREQLESNIRNLLSAEIVGRDLPITEDDKFAAYYDTCLAFVEERLQMYDPVGIQYIFERLHSREVTELEFQLNWYNSRAEFKALVAAAGEITMAGVNDEQLPALAEQLVACVGAFPNISIIEAYRQKPTLNKLPDYIVSLAIEKMLR